MLSRMLIKLQLWQISAHTVICYPAARPENTSACSITFAEHTCMIFFSHSLLTPRMIQVEYDCNVRAHTAYLRSWVILTSLLFFMHVQNNQDSVEVNVGLLKRLLLFSKPVFIVFKCLFQWTCTILRFPWPLNYNSSFHFRENLSRLSKGHLRCWTFHVRHSLELHGKNKCSRWKRFESFFLCCKNF